MIRSGTDGPLFWVTWSPDSTRVAVPLIDERKVRQYVFTEACPPTAPTRRAAARPPAGLPREYLGYGHDTFRSPDSRDGLVACFSERADRLSLLAFDAETGRDPAVGRALSVA